MATAQDEILRRIRAALGDVPEGETPDDVPVERGYRRTRAPREEHVERFIERVAEYKATVRRVARGELPGAIARPAPRGVKRLVVPADLPKAGSPRVSSCSATGRRSPTSELDASDGVLTACALGSPRPGRSCSTAARARGGGR